MCNFFTVFGILVERDYLTTRRKDTKPIIKYWKVSLQKDQIQKTRRALTATDCVEKIRMAEIQL